MLVRELGGLALRAEARSFAMLRALLEDFFPVYFHEVLIGGHWMTVAVGMIPSLSHHAAVLVPHLGPQDPARVAAPRPRAEPLPTFQHTRREQLVGARA